jgi:hypothetical protein
MVLRIRGKYRSDSFSIRTLILVLVLTAVLGSSGCIDQYSGGPQQPAAPSAEEGVQQGGSLPTQTIAPAQPSATELESKSGYIARSFGLVPYATPPNYHITYIDSVAKRDGNGAVYIQGRLKNEGPASLNYLHVTYHLFDVNGNVLGNVDATIEYLPTGMTWHYTTSSYRTDYYQYYQLAGLVAQ